MWLQVQVLIAGIGYRVLSILCSRTTRKVFVFSLLKLACLCASAPAAFMATVAAIYSWGSKALS